MEGGESLLLLPWRERERKRERERERESTFGISVH